ncbi:primosomal protein N', partial [Burkholderia cenocepacia]|nr:primosomal protein N' [Burkholderia cenocepacia]
MSGTYLRVALDHPLATLFDYRCDVQPTPVPGTLVQVPFGKRQAVGLVCEVTTHTDVPPSRLRAVDAICADLPPLSADWLALVSFAADYYQRGRGEVALPALPQALRDAGRWGRLLAPEVRYRPTEAGRAALPDA